MPHAPLLKFAISQRARPAYREDGNCPHKVRKEGPSPDISVSRITQIVRRERIEAKCSLFEPNGTQTLSLRQQQAGIAVAEEPVFFLDCVTVSCLHFFQSHQRAGSPKMFIPISVKSLQWAAAINVSMQNSKTLPICLIPPILSPDQGTGLRFSMRKILYASAFAATISGCGSDSIKNVISEAPDCGSQKTKQMVTDIAGEHELLQVFIRVNGEDPNRPQQRSIEDDKDYQSLVAKRDNLKADLERKVSSCANIPLKFVPLYTPYKSGIIDPVSGDELINMKVYSDDNIRYIESLREDMCRRGSATGNATQSVRLTPQREYFRSVISGLDEQISEADAQVEEFKKIFRQNESERIKELWDKSLASMKYSLSYVIMTDRNNDTGAVECKAQLEGDIPNWGGATEDIKFKVEKTTDGELYVTLWER